MRVGLLADAHGLECTPHNWGNVLDLAMHFHVELALPNVYWFEMPFPAEYTDRSYFKYKFRADEGRLYACAHRSWAGLSDRPRRTGQGDDADRSLKR